jgi:tetratricopeptide (TPR) repeat protein
MKISLLQFTFILTILVPSTVYSSDQDLCGNSPAKGSIEACGRLIKSGDVSETLARHYFNRGIGYESGQVKRALADYSEAIRLNESYSFPYNNRANIYDQQRKYKLALQDYNRSVELDQTNAYALNSRGRHFLTIRNDAVRALDDFNRAIASKSDFAIAYANRGFAHQKLGKADLAIKDLEKALSLTLTEVQRAEVKKQLRRLLRK